MGSPGYHAVPPTPELSRPSYSSGVLQGPLLRPRNRPSSPPVPIASSTPPTSRWNRIQRSQQPSTQAFLDGAVRSAENIQTRQREERQQLLTPRANLAKPGPPARPQVKREASAQQLPIGADPKLAKKHQPAKKPRTESPKR